MSERGIESDPSKLEAVKNWPKVTNIKELRRFLGFTSYHRKYVKDYAKIVKPLNDLLIGHQTNKVKGKKGVKSKSKPTPWSWGDAEQRAFDTVVDKLTSPPVLAYADYSLPFSVHIDASGDGLGAILYQQQDGVDRVIAYASRGLRNTERRYPAHKREFLALKWAVTDKFHDYLYGSKFVVHTDNNPLTYVLGKAKLDATGHRWIAALANYDFSLVYRSGKSNVAADALSRITPVKQELFNEAVKAICDVCLIRQADCPSVECVLLSQTVDVSVTSNQEPVAFSDVDWIQEQQSDPAISRVIELLCRGHKPTRRQASHESVEVQKMLREWGHLVIKDGIMYRKSSVFSEPIQQLVLPTIYRDVALSGLHDDVGHQGRDRTLYLVKRRFYWPGVDKDVERKVASCENCILRKTKSKVAAELVNITTTQPMELVCIDFLSLEQSKGGYDSILVITDHFTGYAQAIPTKNQTAHTTAKCLWESFIQHYSFPARLHSDQGKSFECRVIQELCRLAGVKKSKTTPYHAMGNGQCERFNQTLLSMLGTLDDDKKSDWKSYVAPLVHAYNATRHERTGYSPHFLMFGWHPRLAIDAFLGTNAGSVASKDHTSYVKQLEKRLQFAYATAAKHADKSARRHKSRYDLKVRESIVNVGDRVLVKNVSVRGKCKLANRWERQPYIVDSQPDPSIPVYVIVPEYGRKRPRTVHRNLLLPIGSLPTTELSKEITEVDKISQGRSNTSSHVIREKSQPQISVSDNGDNVTVCVHNDEDSGEHSESDDSIAYVIPQRRGRSGTGSVRRRHRSSGSLPPASVPTQNCSPCTDISSFHDLVSAEPVSSSTLTSVQHGTSSEMASGEPSVSREGVSRIGRYDTYDVQTVDDISRISSTAGNINNSPLADSAHRSASTVGSVQNSPVHEPRRSGRQRRKPVWLHNYVSH